MSILIRPATAADLPAIQEIYNDAVLKLAASYDLEPQTLSARQAWFDEHQREGLPMVVADDAGRVVGWGSLSRFRDRPGYRYTVENSIYIAESERGRGIGKQILAGQIDAARALGLHAIIAVIDAGSEASLRIHESFGFEKVGQLREVGRKFDRWLDVVYMQLLLV
jgi:phosphinothricin acetyltransferase